MANTSWRTGCESIRDVMVYWQLASHSDLPLGTDLCTDLSMKGAGMAVIWSDLSKDEQTALKRMNRGPYPDLSPALAARLVALGVAEQRPRGVGINRAGRELVISVLLAARPD